jgi:hypothetical protein
MDSAGYQIGLIRNIIVKAPFDISEEMIKAASNYVENQKTCFIKSDKITKLADYSFTSGIFNVKFKKSDEEWKNYILETLSNMNEYSKKGFSFNLLTTYVDYKEEHLYYGDPLFFFDYCKKKFSENLSLIHNYNLWDWTIHVKK